MNEEHLVCEVNFKLNTIYIQENTLYNDLYIWCIFYRKAR